MTKIWNKIMKINFSKKLKEFVVGALCIILISGGTTAFLLSPQIAEVITNIQNYQENEDNSIHSSEQNQLEEIEIGEKHHKENDVFENMNITKPSVLAKIAIGVTGLICALTAVTFWLLIAAWLYKAAILSGMNGLLWFLLGLCGTLFAVILFHLVRSFKRKKCSSCGHYSSVTARYCTECGAVLTEKCTECGGSARSDDKFCPSCGKQMPKN